MTSEVKNPYPLEAQATEVKLTHNGANFAATLYSAEKSLPYKGRILIVHGYRDHLFMYYRFINELTKLGFDVFFYWQRGEGETLLEDGSKGFAEEGKVYADLDYMIEYNFKELEKTSKPGNLVLLGHSMGGGIVLNYSIIGTYRNKLKGISATAPLIILHENTRPPLVTTYLVKFLCLFPPARSLRVSTPLKVEYLSGDEDVKSYLLNRGKTLPLGTAFVEARDFVTRGERLMNKSFYSKADSKTPILICHGDLDGINSHTHSKEFIENLKGLPQFKDSDHLSHVEVPGGRHCLLADSEEPYEVTSKNLIKFYQKILN